MFGRSSTPLSNDEKRARMEAMYEGVRARMPGVPEISADEVLARQQAGERMVLVDVRSPEEQAVSMIEGAITAEAFEADRAAHADAEVVVYCTIGGRSGKYAETLNEQGIRAANLKGAILAWTHAGGALRDANGPTTRVHVWAPKANFAADGYEPVW